MATQFAAHIIHQKRGLQLEGPIKLIHQYKTIQHIKHKKGIEKILAMTYSPTKRIRSTIGAGGLNFCVRNGYRCDPSAIITRIFLTLFYFLRNHIPTVPSKLLNV